MCGDLEEYDPGKHVDLLLDGINKHIGRPRIVSSSTWAQDIADLEFTLSEEEQEEGMALLCMCYPVEASEGEGIEIETQSDWGYSLGVAEWKGATGEIGGRSPTPLMDGDLKGL